MAVSARNRTRPVAAAVLAAAALFAIAPTASAREPTGAARAIQPALDAVVAAGAPGAIALVREGNRTIRLSSGYGNLATKTPIRIAHPSRIGGMTKSFTATVVLQLVGEGKLTLDDTVERWLPGRISNGAAITVRQLLNHTSGIFDYTKDEQVLATYLSGNPAKVFDLLTGLKVAADHGPVFAPGSQLSYSNTNYVLLGLIVTAATGRSIGSELRDRIFEPLRLGHTTYPTSSRIPGAHTHGYLLVGKLPLMDVTSFSPTLASAAAAMVSTADDVARFYRALLRGRLLGRDQLSSMETVDVVASDPPGVIDSGLRGGGWGLGLLRETFPCGEAWGHDAENLGYMTAAWNSKDGSRQIVVIANRLFTPNAPASRALRKVLVTAYCR